MWLGSKEKTLIYKPKPDEMVLTAHRWFANKSCPGDWLYSRYSVLADRVSKLLDVAIPVKEIIITSEMNPFSEPSIDVKKGTKGEGAKWVQWYLWRFGLLKKEEIDGIIGQKSYIAIREAQRCLGLVVDGIVGKASKTLWKKIC